MRSTNSLYLKVYGGFLINKYWFFLFFLNLFIISIAFTSCTINESFDAGETYPSPIPTTATMVSTSSPVIPTPTKIELADTLPHATLSVEQLSVKTTVTPMVNEQSPSLLQNRCVSPPTIFNLRNSLDIQLLTQLSFLDETTILVEGWSPSDSINILLEQPELPDNESSEYIPLKKGILDITDEMITPLILEEQSFPTSAICSSTCYAELLENSPNEQWQMKLVRIGLDEERGIWLASENEKVRLVDFVPSWSRWYWSEDGSMLWFEYAQPEFGIGSGNVQLESSPKVVYTEVSKENPLDSTWYFVAFSPQDKTARSVRNLQRQGLPDITDNLYLYDFADNLTEPVSVETISGLVKVEWNNATQSYLKIITEDEAIKVVDMTEGSNIQLPFDAFEGILSVEVLQHNIPFSFHAVSSSRDHLAVSLGDGRVFVFNCETSTNLNK